MINIVLKYDKKTAAKNNRANSPWNLSRSTVRRINLGARRYVALPDQLLRQPAQQDPCLRLGVREGYGDGQETG